MNWKRLIIFASIAGAAFGVGYGAVAKAWPTPYYVGFFNGAYDGSGVDVWPIDSDSPGCSASGGQAIPGWVDSAPEFINFVFCKLNSPNNYGPYRNMESVGAAFIIQSMRGASGWPDQAAIDDWVNRVNLYDSRGWINWWAGYGYNFNSYYQGTYNSSSPNDDAFFPNNSSATSIVFSDGASAYAIRRQCANPVGNGSLPALNRPWYGYGHSTVTSGATTGSSVTAAAGTSVTFRHYIQNTGDSGFYSYNTFGRNEATTPWVGQYYNNTSLSGSPVLTRSDQDISYIDNAGNTPIAPGVNVDGFSVRWTRTQTFPAGDYRFTMKIDDGGRLYIDGVLVIDRWIGQGATPYSYYRAGLPAGTHTIVMEYYEGGGPGWATLNYSNYSVAGAAVPGGFYNGEDRLVSQETYPIPANAAAGTQICRNIWWNWKNWIPAGDSGAGAGAYGQMVCATVPASYSLTPTITVQVNGGAVSGNLAEPGDTVTFTYAVNNSVNGVSAGTTCTYRQATHSGYSTTAPVTAFTPSGANCPPVRTFPANSTTTTATESTSTGAANTSLCRSFSVTPATPAGITRTSPTACAHIAAKPYARVYGGDVSVGGGLVTDPNAPSSCSQSSAAAVVGWNRRSSGAYAGAGVQFAAYAMSRIFDTATSLGNTGGAAPPTSLSFANTSINTTNGNFGGSFGSASCVQDYYSTKPDSTSALPASIGAGLPSGSYFATGNVTLGGGTVLPGTKVDIYVDGNLLITNTPSASITYGGSGSWTSSTIPMLRVIVRGNIFIDNDISQLDGLYVAQPDGATGGIIYTCAITTVPFVPLALNGALASECNHAKLTVNGGLVAKQVRLLRTTGTLRTSGAGENASTGNMAEAFNYNPALWISQPTDDQNTAEYDAINSLPPVL